MKFQNSQNFISKIKKKLLKESTIDLRQQKEKNINLEDISIDIIQAKQKGKKLRKNKQCLRKTWNVISHKIIHVPEGKKNHKEKRERKKREKRLTM